MKPIAWKRSHWLNKIISLNASPRSNIPFIWMVLLVPLIISACDAGAPTPYAANDSMLMATQVPMTEYCESCAQATLAVILTMEKGNADFQAAATAAILHANAQATLNSTVATLSAAQTQEQNNSNIIAAQIAATAEIVRANAQATLNSAGATQIAAMTQAQYNLQATDSAQAQSVIAMQTQQNKDDLAASTQTAIANAITTQTQSAVATSQWYTDQERQREEERRGPIDFLWMWCLPIFLVLLAGLILWGFKRWLSIQQSNQRILAKPVETLPVPAVVIRQHRYDDPTSYIESDMIDGDSYQVITPENKVHKWLDEVKDELSNRDEKENNDDPGN